MTPPNEHTSEGGRDDRGVPYHAESTLSSAQVLKCVFECVCSDTGASKSTRSSAKEQAAPEIALCINGGGSTPPAEMYGQPPSIWTYLSS